MGKSVATYKEQQEELNNLLDRLQSEEIDVDEALKLYEEAASLIKTMEDRLVKAKNHVEELKNQKT